MENPFLHPTYVVLNVPAPTADAVKAWRRRFDPARAELAVEISLSGSCGLGSIAPDEDPVRAFTLIDLMAAAISPFQASFAKVENFHHTGIYFLSLSDPEPFRHLHRQLAASGIRFLPTPWPYEPHCTLTLCHTMHKHQALELMKLRPPAEPFLLTTLSVYQLPDQNRPRLLHRCNLGGARQPCAQPR